MKTKNIFLTAALLLAGVCGGSVQAQEHLSALVKKCESMDKVDMNVIYDKNKETLKTEKVIKSIQFTDEQLAKEFLAAFEKDKEKAYKVIDGKGNGRIVPSFYRFSVGNTDISYSADFSKSGNTSISVIERFNNDPKKGKGEFNWDN